MSSPTGRRSFQGRTLQELVDEGRVPYFSHEFTIGSRRQVMMSIPPVGAVPGTEITHIGGNDFYITPDGSNLGVAHTEFFSPKGARKVANEIQHILDSKER